MRHIVWATNTYPFVVESKGRIVVFMDFTWDLTDEGITLDRTIELEKLGWEVGEYFKLVEIDGAKKLLKVTDLEKFLVQGVDNKSIE
jgi:hypothetical protein